MLRGIQWKITQALVSINDNGGGQKISQKPTGTYAQ
jgi:hypothetical protein